ncbi:MAG: MFS transporter [Roseburia sp.]|nr:MFS transporter [Roseburia sp.]
MKTKMSKIEKYWVLYDVGNSAFTLLVSTIIPIYYKNMAASGGVSASDSTAYLSYAISISTLLVAILGPILGTVADNRNHKKPLFTFFMMMGVLGCAGLAIPRSWLLFLIIFVIAKVGFSGSLIFYDAMLVDVTTDERMDEVSSQGFAWGYIGSCVPFVVSLGLIFGADTLGISATVSMMLAFFINAAWWAVVTLPLLKNYQQKYYVEAGRSGSKETFGRLWHVLSEIKENKKVLWFLVAFFFYIDGVYTIIEMATSYGKDVGISDTNLLLALLFTQVVAFPCAILFGKLTKRFESSKLILVCIGAYFLVAVYALWLDAAWKFWLMATFVGVFQGAIQALSRSYFAKIIPKEKSSEYFGIFDIFGKGASFMGTMLMGITTQLFGTSRAGVVVIAAMFVAGFICFKVQCGVAAKEESALGGETGFAKERF